MSLGFINPSDVRRQTLETKTKSLPGVGFADVANAVGNTGATALSVTGGQKGYQSAAVMQAAISGVAGAPGAMGGNAANAPYMQTASGSPFGSGGYSYSGTPSAGGYVGAGASAGIPGASAGIGVGTTGAPSQDYQEKQALFQQMNDANWEMLVAQVTVSEISRDYQARSNILKTKSDTELNAVRNMRA